MIMISKSQTGLFSFRGFLFPVPDPPFLLEGDEGGIQRPDPKNVGDQR